MHVTFTLRYAPTGVKPLSTVTGVGLSGRKYSDSTTLPTLSKRKLFFQNNFDEICDTEQVEGAEHVLVEDAHCIGSRHGCRLCMSSGRMRQIASVSTDCAFTDWAVLNRPARCRSPSGESQVQADQSHQGDADLPPRPHRPFLTHQYVASRKGQQCQALERGQPSHS